MKTVKYYRLIPIFLGLIIFGYFYIYKYVYQNSSNFYKNPIQTKIIKIRNYENKSLQFYYTNQYCITTTDTKNDTLQIGDSISKKANTGKFSIYRKDNFGKYKFYKNYNIE